MSKENTPTRVLAIVGSPRRNGNTETLVDAVLSGAEQAGAQTEKVSLRDLDIRPCLACDACQRTGACAQKDDMAGLLSKMQESQVWVLGTPVYWWGPTAQFKAFLDRWQQSKHKATFPAKRVILAIPFEDTYAAAPRHTLSILTEALNYLGAQPWHRARAGRQSTGILQKPAVQPQAIPKQLLFDSTSDTMKLDSICPLSNVVEGECERSKASLTSWDQARRMAGFLHAIMLAIRYREKTAAENTTPRAFVCHDVLFGVNRSQFDSQQTDSRYVKPGV